MSAAFPAVDWQIREPQGLKPTLILARLWHD
jgi:hypothetical protein